jgi:hypothetical protein
MTKENKYTQNTGRIPRKNPTIKFTIEKELQTALTFSNFQYTAVKKKIEFTIYRKPTQNSYYNIQRLLLTIRE